VREIRLEKGFRFVASFGTLVLLVKRRMARVVLEFVSELVSQHEEGEAMYGCA